MNDEEHRKRKYILLAVIALLIAFLAFFLAQNAQTTADNNANITNVFEIVINNTDLGSLGTMERVKGTKYHANEYPIYIEILTHTVNTGQDIVFNFSINDTVVWEYSKRSAIQDEHHSMVQIVPKFASYELNASSSIHHYEWREYPILSGRNGTLSVNQTFITNGSNYNASYVPYNGATQNITVGYNKFAIISMDGNSTIQLPNSSDGQIIIAQNQSGVTGHNRCALTLDSVGSIKCSNDITLTNATIDLTTETIRHKINDTTIVAINKTGLDLGSYDIEAHNINDTIIRNYTSHIKLGSFTRDISLATGTQSITGVGFKPSEVDFLAALGVGAQTNSTSVGFDDGTNHFEIESLNGFVPGTFQGISTQSIGIAINGTAVYRGHIQSMDNDGFTISWTRFDSPTGIATIYYKANR